MGVLSRLSKIATKVARDAIRPKDEEIRRAEAVLDAEMAAEREAARREAAHSDTMAGHTETPLPVHHEQSEDDTEVTPDPDRAQQVKHGKHRRTL
ncbi:MAG: hypothetical protein ACE366_17745 [Bradymonadia bacterium]